LSSSQKLAIGFYPMGAGSEWRGRQSSTPPGFKKFKFEKGRNTNIPNIVGCEVLTTVVMKNSF
jgi:hypothetical protein